MTPVVLTGEAFERGYRYGAALKAEIAAHLAAWLGALADAGLGEPRDYVAGMLAATDFRPAIERHTPDLWQESQGIAAGAALAPDLILGLQLLDEEWAYRVRTAGGGALEKCSSVGIVSADGPTWIGQTMDLGGYTDGFQTLLSLGADGDRPAALVFTVAGMIGLMGVNAAGVGVCVNSLPQLPSAPQGLPVAFVLRRLLQARSHSEAVDLVLALPHATNQHYLIAAPGVVRSFEACAHGVTEYHSAPSERVLHTNHPLAAKGAPETEAARANSVARLQALQARLSNGEPGPADIKAALCSRDDPRNPVSRVRGEPGGLVAFTTGSMLSELTAGRVEAWVSPGPPSRVAYAHFVVTPEP
ncbi:MAG: C45 family autoproteolytic acyltransferase/hydrolase [Phenylobacterium sp.]